MQEDLFCNLPNAEQPTIFVKLSYPFCIFLKKIVSCLCSLASMAVASDLSLHLRPQPFFVVGSSAKFPTHINGECTNDSDDDYGYVASLAEQIAHAMLDDDEDCHEDAFVRERVGCSPFRPNAVGKVDIQAAAHNGWLRGKASEARSSMNSSSSALFVPSYRHDFTYFARNQAERTVGCESTILACSAGEHAYEMSGGQPVDWHLLPHMSRASQLAVVPLLESSPAAMPTSENVTNYASPKVCDDISTQIRDCRGNLDSQHRDRLPSYGRNRHRRQHLGTEGRRQGVCHYCGQASPPTSWHSVVAEGAENGALLLGYSNVRKETAGTGVFLPRIMATGSNNRRKSASKIAHAQEERKTNVSPNRGHLDVLQ